jgi:hypothetical protein
MRSDAKAEQHSGAEAARVRTFDYSQRLQRPINNERKPSRGGLAERRTDRQPHRHKDTTGHPAHHYTAAARAQRKYELVAGKGPFWPQVAQRGPSERMQASPYSLFNMAQQTHSNTAMISHAGMYIVAASPGRSAALLWDRLSQVRTPRYFLDFGSTSRPVECDDKPRTGFGQMSLRLFFRLAAGCLAKVPRGFLDALAD